MSSVPKFNYIFNGNNTFTSELDGKTLSDNNWVVTESVKRKCIFSSTLPEELEIYRNDLIVNEERGVIIIYIYVPVVRYIYNGNKSKRKRVLPPFIVKFKQYSVFDIQDGVEKAELTLSDESTIRRWRKRGRDKRKDIEYSFFSFVEHNSTLFKKEYTLSSFYSHLKELYSELALSFLIQILIIEKYHFP